MARHNRDGQGSDQRGLDYEISYQPDWLNLIKVTRKLESGRQSTKTLFRNPGDREQPPGPKIRTGIASTEQELDIEVVIHDPDHVVTRVIIETEPPVGPDGKGADRNVVFTVENRLPSDAS